MSRYVQNSTLHGFQYAASNTYHVRKILWTGLMLTGFMLFIFKMQEGVLLKICFEIRMSLKGHQYSPLIEGVRFEPRLLVF